jgi:hypothetical protein
LGALATLREKMSGYPHGYEPSAQLFLTFDVARTAREMRLEARGSDNGAAGRPGANDAAGDEVEAEIARFIEGEKKQALDILTDRMRDYGDRLGRLDVTGRAGEIEASAKEAIAEFQTEIELGLGELYRAERTLHEQEAWLHEFRRHNRLQRPASYPSSALLVVGVILCVGLVEVVLNTYFFAGANEFGFLGGFLEALIVAVLNVGAGVLTGLTGARFVSHRNYALRLAGLLILTVWLIFVAVGNLVVGHYRELLAEPDLALVGAIPRFLADPLGLTSIQTWALVALGLAASLIALIEAFRMDDPYPGYGAVTRRHDNAMRRFLQVRADIVIDLANRKDEGLAALRSAREDLRKRRDAFFAARNGRRQLLDQFHQHLEWLEAALKELIERYRGANVKARQEPAPPWFAQCPVLIRPKLAEDADPVGEDKVRGVTEAADGAAKEALEQMLAQYEAAMSKLSQLEQTINERRTIAARRDG